MDWCLPTLVVPCIAPGLSNLCRNVLSCLSGRVDNMVNLKENLESLTSAMDTLKADREAMVNKVNVGELKGGQRLPTVTRWLLEVQTVETDTNLLVAAASALDQRLSTSGCSSMDNISNFSLGDKVLKKLNEVRDLSSKGEKFEVVTGQAPPPVVEKRNVEQTFGLQATFEKTWESLMKDENRKLGIYGMGGVGKTTLLTLINNKFDDVKDDFDIVIWVQVSKDADVREIQDDKEKIQDVIKKIQDTIGKRLRIYDEKWSTYSKEDKAEKIGSVLTYRMPRFVLLLDDLWEEVSLSEVGIPLLGREYKVVSTSRSKDVCVSMVKKEGIKVELLAENDAWDLFKMKASCNMLNDEILDIAKKIAAKCCGLPLALEVIGKTMGTKNTLDQWSRALETLESYPSDLKGTTKIFQVLKLSYDYLEKEDAKLCFQYCALFPKAYNIKRDELVEYWIGEGIIDIDDKDGRERARAKLRGHGIIDTLVGAGLLLEDDESEPKPYMHDTIREMALWIVSKSEKGEKYVVQAGAGLSQLPDVADWKSVTKMSLMNNQIESIPDDSEFPDQARLITLFLQNNKLVDIVGRFFQVLSTLVVLDLSHNLNITELPKEISMLVALRYLSLLGTMIKYLPDGLGKLTQLIHLDLESTSDLRDIRLISGLLKLQVLKFYGSAALDGSLLNNLVRLKGLQHLTITLREVDVLEAFLGSELAGKTHGLYLEGLKLSGASFAPIGGLASFHSLEMANCDFTPFSQITPSNTWFKNLKAVVLISCVGLKDVTWLIYAASLESLNVESSTKMEILINRKKATRDVEPFRNLQALRLHYLDKLRRFYWRQLSFPKLKQNKVDIVDCPELKELHSSLCFSSR